MPCETIQIGSLIISKNLIDLIFPLLGTIIGGVIAYFASRFATSQKWKQEKLDRLATTKREAIASALEWLDPIQHAISEASTKFFISLDPSTDYADIFHKWPDLLSNLANLEMSQKYRLLLPIDVYPKGIEIINKLEELRTWAVKINQEVKIKQAANVSYERGVKTITDLNTQLNELSEILTEEYKNSFT